MMCVGLDDEVLMRTIVVMRRFSETCTMCISTDRVVNISIDPLIEYRLLAISILLYQAWNILVYRYQPYSTLLLNTGDDGRDGMYHTTSFCFVRGGPSSGLYHGYLLTSALDYNLADHHESPPTPIFRGII